MKRLILMRHAKSDWSGGPAADIDRPLNARGRAGAETLGVWLRQQALIPDQVLCSAAARTVETLDLLAVPEPVSVARLRTLYLASHLAILDHLRQARGDVVLVLGHNPGIGVAAELLVAAPPDHPRFADYPTGATLVADFEIAAWDEVDWGMGTVQHFVVPRDL